MSSPVALQESREVWGPPASKPLDEAVWQAWRASGRERERRGDAARIEAVRWILLAGLFAIAALWSYLAPYDVVVRFIVAAGAIVLTFHAFHARHYVSAAMFGALALLYNPVTPVFNFTGEWPRAVAVASFVLFAVSFAWRKLRTEHNA